AQDGAAAGGEFLKAEGLREEVIGAEVEAAHALLDLAAAGENQHGGAWRLLGENSQNLAAVALRHHQVRLPAAGAFDGSIAVPHPLHFMALEGQAPLEKDSKGAIILHYQNTH